VIPGDLLVTRRSLWADMRGNTYLDVWESPETWANWAGKWEHHKFALLLGGREIQEPILQAADSDPEDPVAMREVLLDGRVVWVVEDEIVEVVT
jgi:hypothetical protein